MNHFLYRLQPIRPEMLCDGPTEHDAVVVRLDFEYFEQPAAGFPAIAGRTLNSDEKAFGIVVFGASSEPNARVVMQNDSAVAGGVIRSELFAWAGHLNR